MATRLYQFLLAACTRNSQSQRVFWLTLSGVFAVIYAGLGLQEAFSSAYVVQDDARQHVFWMQRFIDPELFPDDLIADYFQSVAPAGYTTLYRLAAFVGIHPLLFNKLLPLGLGLITTTYCFGLSLRILPVPLTGFVSALLLNQVLWAHDDLVSGTPRAFVYPLLLAFLYHFAGWHSRARFRSTLLLCCTVILLQGLFYPQTVFLSAGMLLLKPWRWRGGRLHLSRDTADYWFSGVGLGVAFLVLLPYALGNSQFGPVITAAAARAMPEFWPGGRANFFVENDFWQFWIDSNRSGLLPRTEQLPVLLYAALLLPLLLRWPELFPLNKQVTGQVHLFWQLAGVSCGWFFIAHAVLFKLHLPSRYAQHSFRMVLVLAAGVALTLIVNAVLEQARWRYGDSKPLRSLPLPIALGLTTLLGVALIGQTSFVEDFPQPRYKDGQAPALYAFLAQQPKNSLIASLSEEADFLPTFAARSVLVAREHSLPYHRGYYHQVRQRVMDLIQAQYSPDIDVVRDLIWRYGIDYWLLEKQSFTPEYVAENSWLTQFQPAASAATMGMQVGDAPILFHLVEKCSVLQTEKLVLLQTDCILETKPIGSLQVR